MNPPRFTERLVREQDAILAEKDYIATVKARLSFQPEAYRRRRSNRIRILAAGLGAVAAAAILAIVVATLSPSPSPSPPSAVTVLLNGRPVVVGEWISGALDTDKKLAFSDGSAISLSRNAGLRIQNLHANGARLLLEHGSLSARIVHRGKTYWKLNVGPYTIDVKGTRFDVGWAPETRSFRLDLREGAVNVSGPMLREGRLMKAGEKMLASLSKERIEIEDADQLKTVIYNGKETADKTVAGLRDATEVEHSLPADATASSPLRQERAVTKTASFWKALAEAGRYSEASAAAEKSGVSYILKTDSASDLMTLGDAARRSGNTDLAEQAYNAVRRRFSDTAHASGAAFALGLIAFDHRHAYRDAAKWFDECLRSKKPGAFAREASGRLMEALDRAGDRIGAEQAARRYIESFPNGPHAPLARKLASVN